LLVPFQEQKVVGVCGVQEKINGGGCKGGGQAHPGVLRHGSQRAISVL